MVALFAADIEITTIVENIENREVCSEGRTFQKWYTFTAGLLSTIGTGLTEIISDVHHLGVDLFRSSGIFSVNSSTGINWVLWEKLGPALGCGETHHDLPTFNSRYHNNLSGCR